MNFPTNAQPNALAQFRHRHPAVSLQSRQYRAIDAVQFGCHPIVSLFFH